MKTATKLITLLVMAAIGTGAADASAPDTAKERQKKANAKAAKMIRDGRYVGVRGDGAQVDATFCRNGKYRTRTDDATSTGNRWFVRNAKFTKKGFTAIVAENKRESQGGFSIAIGRRKGQWRYGISAFGDPSELGPVERSGAKQECATL